LPNRENAKVPQFDAVAARHRRDNLVDYSVDDFFHIVLVEARVPIGDKLDELGFEHCRPHATVMRLAKGRNPVKANSIGSETFSQSKFFRTPTISKSIVWAQQQRLARRRFFGRVAA
jgi:hypothetical protein